MNTQETIKKEKEWKIIKALKRIWDNFPNGSIEESEEPDFILKTSSCDTIGIELTEYFQKSGKKGSKLKQKEELINEIVEMAKKEFEEISNDKIMVSFNWSENLYVKGKEKQKIASNIAQLIHQHSKKLDGPIDIEYEDLPSQLQDIFSHSIEIYKNSGLQENEWNFIDAGIIGTTFDEINKIISEKQKKIGDYLKKCDEIWLLIYTSIEPTISSSLTNKDLEKLKRHDFNSRFLKVIFYDSFSNSFELLNVR